MNDVDKLTLELFTSKNTYRKYLAKTDPETFQKQERLQEKIMEYKPEIRRKLDEMLDSSSSSSSGELVELFERLIFGVLQEIEMESESSKRLMEIEDLEEEEEEEEVMFGIKEKEEPIEKKSFWSKDRVIKQESHYPTNTEIRKRYISKKNIY